MDPDSVQLLSRFRNGDATAAEELYLRYVRRLIGLAKKRLPGILERRVDAEDVVQSAYKSFFAAAKDGQFRIERSGDLWRLLAAITVNKVRRQMEHHGQQKRAIAREASPQTIEDSLQQSIEHFASDPGDEEIVAVADELERLKSELPDRDRTILEHRLNGLNVEEIAADIGRSEWTVRRCLNVLQKRLEDRLLEVD